MSLKIVVDQIKTEISKGLPGESAHTAMSPIDRKKINWDAEASIRESAGAIVLFEKNDSIYPKNHLKLFIYLS